MRAAQSYFFCGIGGSGMMPLAVLLQKKGMRVYGSDRSYDQGKTPDKFKALQNAGLILCPQDGRGISDEIDVLVVSSAIESSIPDVKCALDLDIPIMTRGELLAQFFNLSKDSVAVAGTSGKSSVTGMVGTVLAELGKDPTIVNGGEIRNFRTSDNDKFSGVRKGDDDLFVAEMDESDGSIAHYRPSVAALNNIALDHKTMEELEQLFGDYVACARDGVIANYDQSRVKSLCDLRANARVISYAIKDMTADLVAQNIKPQATGIDFDLLIGGRCYPVSLNVPGRHNVENALACFAICYAMNMDMAACVKGIQAFGGIHRRMELVGQAGGVTVLDDFAHNPDKIAASLQALREFDGRLIIMFQLHGFGPLRMMGAEMADVFARYLQADDQLLIPEVYYAGGTVDRSITAKDWVQDLRGKGVCAHWFAQRVDTSKFISERTKAGDRVVIMGARDDTLHIFAHEVLDMFG